MEYLHPGTSDDFQDESEDILQRQSPWVGEMQSMLGQIAVSAARRWQDTVSVGSDVAAAGLEVDYMDHYDKLVPFCNTVYVEVTECNFGEISCTVA